MLCMTAFAIRLSLLSCLSDCLELRLPSLSVCFREVWWNMASGMIVEIEFLFTGQDRMETGSSMLRKKNGEVRCVPQAMERMEPRWFSNFDSHAHLTSTRILPCREEV